MTRSLGIESPQPLDWKRLPHIGNSIVWEAVTYRHFWDQHRSRTTQATGLERWVRLPFEEPHLKKLPEGGGIYAFSYSYQCLGFPEQEIIMYIGQAVNLRARLGQYIGIAKGAKEAQRPSHPIKTRNDRLRHLFSTFDQLTVQYCPVNLTDDERLELERNLINLLDPPFNWNHRPRPVTVPTIGRPGAFLANSTEEIPAFGQRNRRRT